MSTRRYRLFEVVGCELEYPTVGADDLAARDLVAPLFARMARPGADEVEGRGWGLSNEITAHVLEVKNPTPAATCTEVEAALRTGLHRASAVLRAGFDARLLPTGMHPFLRPAATRLWDGSGGFRRTYRAFARVFSIRTHGFANVQACHVNLPVGKTDADAVALYDTAAALLPYFPAVAASSPVVEGRLGPVNDNRMAFYAVNQRRVPLVAGDVVPEPIASMADHRALLRRIFAALRRVPGGSVLCHDWVDSRGAIFKLGRGALEIRVLDVQECVRMDMALATFVRGALAWGVERWRRGGLRAPHPLLVGDLRACIARGTAAKVAAPHLQPSANLVPARDLLLRLLDGAAAHVPAADRHYLPLVERRIRRGSLSERLRGPLLRVDRKSEAARRKTILRLWTELADCLDRNEPWDG